MFRLLEPADQILLMSVGELRQLNESAEILDPESHFSSSCWWMLWKWSAHCFLGRGGRAGNGTNKALEEAAHNRPLVKYGFLKCVAF